MYRGQEAERSPALAFWSQPKQLHRKRPKATPADTTPQIESQRKHCQFKEEPQEATGKPPRHSNANDGTTASEKKKKAVSARKRQTEGSRTGRAAPRCRESTRKEPEHLESL